MTKVITIKLVQTGPNVGPFTISDLYGNIIAENVPKKTLIAGVSYIVDVSVNEVILTSTGKCKLSINVPLEELTWEELNVPGKQWVRRWFTAYVKETLARVRGKYSGNLKTPDSEITMDYTSLLTEAKDEKSKLLEELTGAEGWLTRLRPEKVMEREAQIAENLNKQMKFRAMPRQIYVI